MTAFAAAFCAIIFGLLAVFSADRLLAVGFMVIAWMLALCLAIAVA